MRTKMIWANLAVSDLERTNAFYSQLGFKSNMSQPSNDLTSFLFSDNNFIIHFFLKEKFEENNGKIANLENGNEIIFSLSANTREEVDQWLELVKNAGGKIFSEPKNFDKGYSFGFCDPDGHKFNFLYWPQ